MPTQLPDVKSFWSSSVSMPRYAPLDGNLEVTVCVIGGGIAGLTTAYLLARSGVSVALVEARELGSGETSHTTAHLAVPDDGYCHIEESYGRDSARLVADSFGRAIDLVQSIVREERIDCDFEWLDGYLISCATNPERALDREWEAAQRAGVQVTRQIQLPLSHFPLQACLRFERQAQFHPLRYLAGLARGIERFQGAIYTGTRVTSVAEHDTQVVTETSGGKVRARAVVVATNTPINDRVAIHTKQTSWQSYVVAARVPAGTLPRILLWDDADPYHYVRLARSDREHEELLIAGGEDHKTGQEPNPQRRYQAVEQWLRQHFPMAGEIAFRWSGQVMEPLDGIAYLGRNPGSREIYVITGDSGNGMTHTTAGAMLVSDLIAKRINPWEAVYSPARKPLKEALRFVRDQSNIASHYTDWLAAADETSAAAIAAGEGAVLRLGWKKLAVYRDEEGALHCHSAACPHLGCMVQWNAAEKTWDCPCHGSRFDALGGVLHGPAVSGLATVPIADEQAIQAAALPHEPQPGHRPADRNHRTRE